MTLADIESIVSFWQSVLPLDQRWRITVEALPENTPEYGRCQWVPGVWTATLFLNEAVPEQQLERVIVHELWELAFHQLSESFEVVADELPGYKMLRRAHQIKQNRLIESLTDLALREIPHPEYPRSDVLSVVSPDGLFSDSSHRLQGYGGQTWLGKKSK